jgi:tetratricopeptide (TPR) repeat protein
LRQLKHPESALVTEEEAAEFFARNENFRYDLFRLPFNEGRGGKAVPLEGAGGDGYSNFFPRYSPDGRWIVFCKARSYMLLQSDSALYVLPAAGGKARRMKCNTSRMNSWHSFSPNGRWLVFSSKAWGPYTRLCLTHFDENGNDTPPVLLADLTFPDRAANIPEFVNIAPEAIAELREQFMDDTSFVRAGTDLFNGREYERAEAAFRKALRLNAANDIARFCLGNTLAVGGRYAEAESEFARAAALVPTRAEYHASLGKARRELKRLPEARTALETALRLDPRHLEARAELGRTLFDAGRPAEAAAELAEAAKASPRDAALRYSLAVALFHAGRKEEARKEAWRAREAAKAANQSAHLEQIERFLAAMENEAP